MRFLLVLSIIFGLCAPASADDKPAVSIIQARKVALGKVPGTIVNEKLKKKKKGKPLTWSIKIRRRGVAESSDELVKIEIDATTAAILKVKDVKARKPEDE